MSLATKYRPNTFEDCCGQKHIIMILNKQLSSSNIKNCYLFAGPSGTGKTTLARIFANKINNGCGNPIEIDGASHNGVDNVRSIIDDARNRSIDSKYKVYIIDEAHMLTVQAWNAFLKCIEEPPKFTIFIFCTTDPQKIPATICNRVMRFNLSKINVDEIRTRLEYICRNEHFNNFEEACDYIAKISSGGMRDAIATLEKCADYNQDLNIDNVLDALGNFAYETFFDLTNAILEKDLNKIIRIIDYCFNSGNDLTLFFTEYLDFLLDLEKYILFNDIDSTRLPKYLLEDLKYTTQKASCKEIILDLSNCVLQLLNNCKIISNFKTTASVQMLQFSRSLG